MSSADAAVLRQVYRYCAAVDAHDLSGLADLFAPDIVLRNGDTYHGRTEALGFFEACFEKMAPTIHFVSNGIVDVAGTTAASESRFHVVSGGTSTARCVAGRYQDELRLDGGTWRFARKFHEVVLVGDAGGWHVPDAALPWTTRGP